MSSPCLHIPPGKKKATDEKKWGESVGQEGERCNWSSADKLCLLDYVTTHKAKEGDGLNFDKTFWMQATAYVAHTTTTSAVKTAEVCQQKWSRVFFLALPLSSYLTKTIQDACHLFSCQPGHELVSNFMEP